MNYLDLITTFRPIHSPTFRVLFKFENKLLFFVVPGLTLVALSLNLINIQDI